MLHRGSDEGTTDAGTTYLSFICLDMTMKASSTFAAVFADVSRKGICNWFANSCV